MVTSFLGRHNIFFPSSKKITWTNLRKLGLMFLILFPGRLKYRQVLYPQGERSAVLQGWMIHADEHLSVPEMPDAPSELLGAQGWAPTQAVLPRIALETQLLLERRPEPGAGRVPIHLWLAWESIRSSCRNVKKATFQTLTHILSKVTVLEPEDFSCKHFQVFYEVKAGRCHWDHWAMCKTDWWLEYLKERS